MNRIAMISAIVFGAIGMSIASAGVYAQGGQYASAPQTTYEFEEIGDISEETDKIMIANLPLCKYAEFFEDLNWTGGCKAELQYNDKESTVIINSDTVAAYQGTVWDPTKWDLGYPPCTGNTPEPYVPCIDYNKESISVKGNQAVAGGFGPGAWFNNDILGTDDPAVAEGGPGAWICSVAGCNEDGSLIDPDAIKVAEGGPGAWICSVAGCNEDGSLIDPDALKVAGGFGPGAWFNEDGSLIEPDALKVAGGFGPGAWFNEDPTATDAPAVAGCWFWEDCKSGNESPLNTDAPAVAEGGPGAWICSVAGCNEDGSIIDADMPAVVGGWGDGLYLEDESHIGYAIVGQGCPNIPGVVCNDSGTIIGSPVPLYNADGNCLIAGGCSNDSAGISGAESVAGGGWGGLGCWICNEDDVVDTELFDDGN